jgi:hypothetical protein
MLARLVPDLGSFTDDQAPLTPLTVKKAAKAAEKAAAKAAKGPVAQKQARGEPKKEKEVKAKEPEQAPYVNTTPKGDKKGASVL